MRSRHAGAPPRKRKCHCGQALRWETSWRHPGLWVALCQNQECGHVSTWSRSLGYNETDGFEQYLTGHAGAVQWLSVYWRLASSEHAEKRQGACWRCHRVNTLSRLSLDGFAGVLDAVLCLRCGFLEVQVLAPECETMACTIPPIDPGEGLPDQAGFELVLDQGEAGRNARLVPRNLAPATTLVTGGFDWRTGDTATALLLAAVEEFENAPDQAW
jgi:hypothetical protein